MSGIDNWLIAPESGFPNHLTAVAYTIFVLCWILSESFNRLRSWRNSSGLRRDRGSFYVIIGLNAASIFATLLFSVNGIGVFVGSAQYLGLGIGFLGIIFRQWSIAVLGKSFTVKVEVDKSRRLTTNGPYGLIRHPSYTGGLMTVVGFALASGTWAGAILTAALMFIAYAYRIRVEEKALTETYGQEYLEYKEKTWRLMPGY